MPARAKAILALTGLALLSSVPARAADGIFGDILSRISGPEKPASPRVTEAQSREREARNLRREYWERERGRSSAGASVQSGLARDVSGPGGTTR